jgi:hypothetical protein
MDNIDYKLILEQAFEEFGRLVAGRDDLELKIAKQFQFIRATVNMLPDEEREKFESEVERLASGTGGLTNAIKNVLQVAPTKWHTATSVRDSLVQSGFDFSSYTANPLASIHSILKRLKNTEAESTTIDGVMAWKWRQASPSLFRRRRYVPRPLGPPPTGFTVKPAVPLATLLGQAPAPPPSGEPAPPTPAPPLWETPDKGKGKK